MKEGPAPVVWGSTEATVAAVVQALLERAGAGKAAGPPATGRAGALRRGVRTALRRAPRARRYEAWRRRWERAATRRCRRRGRLPILDVGCSEGALAARLARATGRTVVGVDITDTGFPRAFDEASRLQVEHLVGCVRRDAHHLSGLGRERFAAATFTYSLHCMKDPQRAVAEAARVLAPGGFLLVVDWIVRPGEARHGCVRLSVSEIEEMLRRAGLAVIQRATRDGVGLVAAQRPASG